MTFYFTKMHGLGNDFMVINAIHQTLDLKTLDIPALSRRDTGVGFDQCLVVEKSRQPGIDFYYRIFNADGQEVGQCGNGARCLARFLKHYQLTDKPTIKVATKTTAMELTINSNDSVTVNMGRPKFLPSDIPLKSKTHSLQQIQLNGVGNCQFHAVNVGNPHAVLVVDKALAAPVENIGSALSHHAIFPEQANIGFMEILSTALIKLRVYERGCGETKACGSGAVAAAVIGRKHHQLQEQITVNLPGGSLIVDWPNMAGDVWLTGPATFIYEAKLL